MSGQFFTPYAQPRKQLYTTDEQKQMLAAFQSDSYVGLLREMRAIEGRAAPSPHNSRLLHLPNGSVYALLVCASVPKKVIVALLDGTFLEKLLNDADWAAQRQLMIHSPSVNPDREDPGCYLNIVARPDGRSLTPVEFERLLTVMEISVGLKPDPGNVIQDVAFVYNNRSSGSWKRFLQDNSSLRTAVSNFVTANRTLKLGSSTTGPPADIQFPAEVGWSMKLTARLRDHFTAAKTSPPLFVLAGCVVHCLWPTQFKMHQLVVFRPFFWQMASIAECILTQLAASYGRYGGFNGIQAGVSVTGAMQTDQWLDHQDTASRTGILKTIEENMDDLTNGLEARLDQINTAIIGLELEERVEKLQSEVDNLKRVAHRAEVDMNRVLNRLTDTNARLERAARRRLELQSLHQTLDQVTSMLENALLLKRRND
ncbi:hypothetical protein LTR16_001658 [Cryomyces antarcticus]|uniref:Uncharacterized protein n=1 Tax=Cryomyces antarcticus TaxID=329879 RepID=A0ABR0LZ48_9PEZI|nr:hypothetical protein LTR39_000722 [Cryomyces antarcticus]KAK5019965.1 hypothetical protein LTR60_000968 [Cryomyces antarcticus]KAK5257081.1 hypothetical protein LTR16_001658 [Cryomyces antarcticus]